MIPLLSQIRSLSWWRRLTPSVAIAACTVLLAIAPVSANLDAGSELLPEDEAFAFRAELQPDQTLRVSWDIADGYYMYRDRIDYELVGDNTLVSPVDLPAGKPKVDPLFGDVEVYTGVFSLELPLTDPLASFMLLATGQGCNEPVGVCYAPIQHEIRFEPAAGDAVTPGSAASNSSDFSKNLSSLFDQSSSGSEMQSAANDIPTPAGVLEPGASGLVNQQADQVQSTNTGTDATEAEAAEVDSVESLRALLSSGFEQPDFLAVEDAFQLDIDQTGPDTLAARFAVADGYYLYRQKIGFSATGAAAIADIALPEGVVKEDEYLGRSMVFKDGFQAPLMLSRGDGSAGPIEIEATYQGCAEEGICYPPVTRTFTLELPSLVSDAVADTGTATAVAPVAVTSSSAVSSASLGGIDERSLLGLLIGAFAAGLLLTFTPCVLPMIPILSSIIAGQGENLTRMRGGMLAVVYVLGTAVTYAVMGAMAGATGDQLQAYFQNAWAIGILAAIFVVMALAMFGLFELQMPAAIQSRLQSGTSSLRGSMPLVFILGIVSALIVGACVSPVLISFLGIAIARADPVLGAQMMSVMALGMGLPLIALGIGAGHLIPRAGPWMNAVRNLFGVMLIGVAIYMLGLLPAVPILLLWGAFFIIVATYLGAQRIEESGGWQVFSKGIGTVLMVWGVAALVGGFTGQRSLLQPIPSSLFQGGTNIAATSAEAHVFTRISDTAELERQFALAASSGKRVIIDFYADWCVDCVRMEKSTFADRQVVDLLNSDFIPLQIDLTDPHAEGPKAIKQQLGVFGPPAVLFFDESGAPQSDRHFYGYRAPDDFLALIES